MRASRLHSSLLCLNVVMNLCGRTFQRPSSISASSEYLKSLTLLCLHVAHAFLFLFLLFILLSRVKATEAVESPVKFFLPFLLDNMKQCFEHPKSCKQFFNTLCSLLQDVTDLSTLRIDTEEILAQLADLIVNHPTVEIVPRDKDHILMGLLRVLTGLVHGRNDLKEKAANPKGYNIMQSVFMDCLFATPSRDHPPVIPPPKAKNAETRRAAYDLLAELSTDLPINSGRLCAMALPPG